MPVGGPHRENWPALQAVRAASSVGSTCGDGVIPTVGVSAAAALRAAVPTRGRRSLACRAISPSGVRAETGVIPTVGVWAAAALRAAVPVGDRRSSRPRACSRSAVRGTHAGGTERHRSLFRAPARCRSETGAPAVLALVLGLWCAALTLAGWSVIGTGFALPRDAGRRPALLAFPCLQRHLGRPADLAAGLLGGTFAESRTPVGERTALPADRRRWKSPAAESRSRWSRWSRCSCRSSRG